MLWGIEGFKAVPGVRELAYKQEGQAEQDENYDLREFVPLNFPVLIRVLSDELVDPSDVGERYKQDIQQDKEYELCKADRGVQQSTDDEVVFFGAFRYFQH